MFKNVAEYLARFKTFAPSNQMLIRETIAAIEAETHIELLPSDLRVERGTIRLLSSPGARSEILLRKGAILRALHARGLEKELVRDIR